MAPDLQLVIHARLADPRVGVAEFRITSLKRVEPRALAFQVPAGYGTSAIHPADPMGWHFWLGPPRRRP